MAGGTPWYDTQLAAAVLAVVAALGGAWLGAWRTSRTATETAQANRAQADRVALMDRLHADITASLASLTAQMRHADQLQPERPDMRWRLHEARRHPDAVDARAARGLAEEADHHLQRARQLADEAVYQVQYAALFLSEALKSEAEAVAHEMALPGGQGMLVSLNKDEEVLSRHDAVWFLDRAHDLDANAASFQRATKKGLREARELLRRQMMAGSL